MPMALTLKHAHSWAVSPREAIAVQERLRGEVVRVDDFTQIRTVAGVDCGFESGGVVTRAAVAVLEFPGLSLIDRAVVRVPTSFPYVPGLLSFREIPAVLAAMEQLANLPDLLLVDGQGYAHPRRFGFASHLGVLTGIPSIGVGKTRLLGTHGEVPPCRGEWTPLLHGEETVGAVLRTRERVNPLFVSLGHRIGLESAVGWVMGCTTRYRLPETTRHAHRLASA
jgi:deoxyribonuclease V